MAPRLRSRSPPTTQQSNQATSEVKSDDSAAQTRPLLEDADDSPSLRSSSFSDSSVGSTTQCSSVAVDAQAVAVARMQHDYFNLFALVFVVATTVINWDWAMMLQGRSPLQCWTGHYFYLNWATTFLYFLSDLIWVAVVPTCVKSPDVIIKHHFITMVYLLGPMKWPPYRWAMGACLSVEVNTWFLILRRVLFKNDQFPGAAIAKRVVSFFFYTSWVVIRCIIYPAVMYQYLVYAYDAIVETNRWFHMPMLVIPLHFFLCILNIKWTFDLFRPIVQGWLGTGDHSTKRTVSSGL